MWDVSILAFSVVAAFCECLCHSALLFLVLSFGSDSKIVHIIHLITWASHCVKEARVCSEVTSLLNGSPPKSSDYLFLGSTQGNLQVALKTVSWIQCMGQDITSLISSAVHMSQRTETIVKENCFLFTQWKIVTCIKLPPTATSFLYKELIVGSTT